MTHAFSVNAVCNSRNDECIYAYKASGYRGHAFKRSFQRVAKSVNGRSPRLMHLTSWHAQLLSQSGALAGVDTARQPLRARCRPSRPSSATGSGPLAARRWRPLAGPGNGTSEAVPSPSRRDPGVHPASGPWRTDGSPIPTPVTPGKFSVYTPAYTPRSATNDPPWLTYCWMYCWTCGW